MNKYYVINLLDKSVSKRVYKDYSNVVNMLGNRNSPHHYMIAQVKEFSKSVSTEFYIMDNYGNDYENLMNTDHCVLKDRYVEIIKKAVKI